MVEHETGGNGSTDDVTGQRKDTESRSRGDVGGTNGQDARNEGTAIREGNRSTSTTRQCGGEDEVEVVGREENGTEASNVNRNINGVTQCGNDIYGEGSDSTMQNGGDCLGAAANINLQTDSVRRMDGIS